MLRLPMFPDQWAKLPLAKHLQGLPGVDENDPHILFEGHHSACVNHDMAYHHCFLWIKTHGVKLIIWELKAIVEIPFG